MDTRELHELVRRSHERHFHATQLRERLRDLAQQVSELSHHRDHEHLVEEVGDAAWSLLQLLNELGLTIDEAVAATLRKLDARAAGRCVDEVWYLIAGEHPWGKKLMPAQHRLEMVRRAVARYPRLKACDFELVHGPEIYAQTRETAFILRDHLLPAFPEYRFSWVMGSDVAQTFARWGGAEWMAEHLDMIVIHRLGYDFDKAAAPRHQYFRDNVVTSNISSTLVRERGRTYEPEKLTALVPDVVWDYLVEHRLLDPDALR
jgi:nicotinate-nucleotide adenylyltransferase